MNISILGTGAYGIALALILNENKNNVTMWTRFDSEKEKIVNTRINSKVLPNVKIPESINITTSIEEACKVSDILVIAIPAAFVDDISEEIAPYSKGKIFVIASKGIEQNTCLFLNDVLAKHNDISNLCVIAGGTFANDIILNKPVGVSLAASNEEIGKLVKNCFQNDHFKVRLTNDIYGVEVCSSIKNVVAIASGILDGLGATDSTRAMFITESLHDIMELIDKLGGDKKTILSFAGFADILLTCTSTQSRNFSFGRVLATGDLDKIEQYKKTHTVEGLYTLESIHQLVKDKNVEIPIIDLIYDIVFKDKDPHSLFIFLIEKK